MAQKTLVVQVPPAERVRLEERLAAHDFERRGVPYAVFSVKGEGVVATLYQSGKLVVQGEDPSLFAERFLGLEPGASRDEHPGAPRDEDPAAPQSDAPVVGSDEVGKGDYFGPLVVAGVRLEPGESGKLRAAGVRDSKVLSDETVLRLGGALRSTITFSIARLDPEAYNALYQKQGQLNAMLADLHAQVVRELHRPGIHVVIDQFASAALMQRRLAGLDIVLEQRPRAEVVPAVAAASIIAREEFLLALRELSERYGVDLHKGAGEPVDRAAREFVALHGREALGRVAKVHFKNSQRV